VGSIPAGDVLLGKRGVQITKVRTKSERTPSMKEPDQEKERRDRTTDLIKKQIEEGGLNIGPDERTLLIAFARAASKAQEIAEFLKDSVIAVEVATDTRDRSFEDIAKEIDNLPLGPLKKRYLETVGKDIPDPGFKEMFDEINRQRIFLMHKFFQVFPATELDGNEQAELKLRQINEILGTGREVLSRAFKGDSMDFKAPQEEICKSS
jgi:hypothetical protein